MKQRRVYGIVGFVAVCLALAVPVGAGTLKCPPDSVNVGNVCIDTYEASVWQIDPANTKLVKKVQDGRATLADLTAGGPSSSRRPASVGTSCRFPPSGSLDSGA
jgi:hypothetical protein